MTKRCDQCNKKLLLPCPETDSIVMQGIVAQEMGYVYKNSILYSGKDEKLFFCTKGCGRKYYAEHGYANAEVTAALKAVRKDIPQMAAQTARAVNNFKNALLEIQKKQCTT
jgi:hypothetical protein